jgi:hypothetical protein
VYIDFLALGQIVNWPFAAHYLCSRGIIAKVFAKAVMRFHIRPRFFIRLGERAAFYYCFLIMLDEHTHIIAALRIRQTLKIDLLAARWESAHAFKNRRVYYLSGRDQYRFICMR